MKQMPNSISVPKSHPCMKFWKMFISLLSIHKSMRTCTVDMIWLLSNSIQRWLIQLLLNFVHLLRFCMVLMIRAYQLRHILLIIKEKQLLQQIRSRSMMQPITRPLQHQKENYTPDQTFLITSK